MATTVPPGFRAWLAESDGKRARRNASLLAILLVFALREVVPFHAGTLARVVALVLSYLLLSGVMTYGMYLRGRGRLAVDPSQ